MQIIDKILIALVSFLLVALVGTAIYAKYYKSKSGRQSTTIVGQKARLGVAKTDNNLTGIAKYAEGVINSIDKEVEREAVIEYGLHTDSF